MYIYADVVFIVNLMMNTLILLLTAWLARISYIWWRILAASSLGSIYVIGGVMPELAIFYTPIFKLILSITIIWLAFGFKNWRTLLIQIGLFYITSFVLGGAVLGWLFFWHSKDLLAGVGKLPVSGWLLFGGSLLSLILLFSVSKFVLNRMLRRCTLFQAKAKYKDKCVMFTGMLDTGNALYTILGRRPVVLVNQSVLENILDDCVKKYLHDYPVEEWFQHLEFCGDTAWLERVQIIPYRAVGNASFILGFRPDRLIIHTGSGIIETDNVVLGVYHGALSSEEMYQALLHPAILQA